MSPPIRSPGKPLLTVDEITHYIYMEILKCDTNTSSLLLQDVNHRIRFGSSIFKEEDELHKVADRLCGNIPRDKQAIIDYLRKTADELEKTL